MSAFNYPTVEDIIAAHDDALDKSGGLSGIKDLGQIESTLYHITNDDYYPEFIDKLTHLTFSIIKNHCFNDGNKRASITSSHLFIYQNVGIIADIHGDFSSDSYTEAMEHIVIFVADNVITKDDLKSIMLFLLSEKPDYLYSFKKMTTVLDEKRAKQQYSDDQILEFMRIYLRHAWLRKIFLWLS